MQTAAEIMRQVWHKRIIEFENERYAPPVQRKPESLALLRKREWCPEFEQLMRNRLLMGYFRYEPIHSPNKGAYDLMGSLQKRFQNYMATGNLENLPDMANMCLLEFMYSRHPKKHFKATDDGVHTQKGTKTYV